MTSKKKAKEQPKPKKAPPRGVVANQNVNSLSASVNPPPGIPNPARQCQPSSSSLARSQSNQHYARESPDMFPGRTVAPRVASASSSPKQMARNLHAFVPRHHRASPPRQNAWSDRQHTDFRLTPHHVTAPEVVPESPDYTHYDKEGTPKFMPSTPAQTRKGREKTNTALSLTPPAGTAEPFEDVLYKIFPTPAPELKEAWFRSTLCSFFIQKPKTLPWKFKLLDKMREKGQELEAMQIFNELLNCVEGDIDVVRQVCEWEDASLPVRDDQKSVMQVLRKNPFGGLWGQMLGILGKTEKGKQAAQLGAPLQSAVRKNVPDPTAAKLPPDDAVSTTPGRKAKGAGKNSQVGGSTSSSSAQPSSSRAVPVKNVEADIVNGKGKYDHFVIEVLSCDRIGKKVRDTIEKWIDMLVEIIGRPVVENGENHPEGGDGPIMFSQMQITYRRKSANPLRCLPGENEEIAVGYINTDLNFHDELAVTTRAIILEQLGLFSNFAKLTEQDFAGKHLEALKTLPSILWQDIIEKHWTRACFAPVKENKLQQLKQVLIAITNAIDGEEDITVVAGGDSEARQRMEVLNRLREQYKRCDFFSGCGIQNIANSSIFK